MTTLGMGILIYLLIFVAFTVTSVLAALYPVGLSSLTHVLFPVVVMLVFGMQTRFGYIKLSTLVAGRLLIILAAIGWGDQIIHLVCLILLQLNILEAVGIDFQKRFYFNAIGGCLLLGSSFFLVLGWTGSYILVENENYILWIFAYTFWNANFVTLQLTGAYFSHHFLILLSPIVACLVVGDFSYWLVFRETSLLLGIAALASFKGKLRDLERQQPVSEWFERFQAFASRKNTQLLLLSLVGACTLIQTVCLR